MNKIRTHRSCLSKQQAEEFLKATKSIDPANYNKRIIKNKPTMELIQEGTSLMKKEGFKIATEETMEL